MWEISSTIVRYDVTERTTPEIALAGIKDVSQRTMGAKTGGAASKRPIANFYQTDPNNFKRVSFVSLCLSPAVLNFSIDQ